MPTTASSSSITPTSSSESTGATPTMQTPSTSEASSYSSETSSTVETPTPTSESSSTVETPTPTSEPITTSESSTPIETPSPTSESVTTSEPATTSEPVTSEPPSSTTPEETPTSVTPTTINVPTCTSGSFLLRGANSGKPGVDGNFAKVSSTYSPINTFTGDPFQASVFFIVPGSNRLAVGDCNNPSFASHWNGDNNPTTNFWFEIQDYINFYGDQPATCQNNGFTSPLTCQIGSRTTIAYCMSSSGIQFVSLLTGLADPSVAQNGQTCVGLDLIPVALPIIS